MSSLSPFCFCFCFINRFFSSNIFLRDSSRAFAASDFTVDLAFVVVLLLFTLDEFSETFLVVVPLVLGALKKRGKSSLNQNHLLRRPAFLAKSVKKYF